MHSLDASIHDVSARPKAIGAGVTALAVVAMAVDHMLDEGGGLAADPPMFAISVLVCLGLGAYLFGRVVPRAGASADRAGRVAAWWGVGAVLTVTTFWVGVPFIVGGAAAALGLAGLGGAHRRRALTAVVLGAAVLAVGVAVYAAQAADKLA